MFKFEQKMTVMNTVLKRTNEYGLPLKSKSRLVFQCGYRRFSVCPIFNEHVEQTNKKVNDDEYNSICLKTHNLEMTWFF